MRLNNLSARLKMNAYLQQQGHEPIPATVDYMEFATRLRRILARTMEQVAFTNRPDAVRYIRLMASSVKIRA